jgi:hypothetical protein
MKYFFTMNRFRGSKFPSLTLPRAARGNKEMRDANFSRRHEEF